MTVYVDELRDYGGMVKRAARRYGTRWCHLTADSKEELHAFAEGLGLRRSWFQDHATLWHYDLTPNKRALAVLHGAVETTTAERVRAFLATQKGGSAT